MRSKSIQTRINSEYIGLKSIFMSICVKYMALSLHLKLNHRIIIQQYNYIDQQFGKLNVFKKKQISINSVLNISLNAGF